MKYVLDSTKYSLTLCKEYINKLSRTTLDWSYLPKESESEDEPDVICVEINSIEDVQTLTDIFGDLIFSRYEDFRGIPIIEIYDDYRE